MQTIIEAALKLFHFYSGKLEILVGMWGLLFVFAFWQGIRLL